MTLCNGIGIRHSTEVDISVQDRLDAVCQHSLRDDSIVSHHAAFICVLNTAVLGVPSDPFHYHWRDIAGNCVADCNNRIYKCPCFHFNMPLQ